MRRSDRIGPVLDEVRAAWLRNPDLRLGQLLYDAARVASEGTISRCPELFYMEDHVLLAGLRDAGAT